MSQKYTTRWTGRGVAREWSARSLYLNRREFYCGDTLETFVFRNLLKTIEDRWPKIIQSVEKFHTNIFSDVYKNAKHR